MTYALPGDWANHAACEGATELMAADVEHTTHALTICATCPVINHCRTWALTAPDPAYGMVAGGLTPRQRSRIRRGDRSSIRTEVAS